MAKLPDDDLGIMVPNWTRAAERCGVRYDMPVIGGRTLDVESLVSVHPFAVQ
jgi:hypothetical protein